MVLSNSDLEKIRNIITMTFNDQFLQDISDKVVKLVSEKYSQKITDHEENINKLNNDVANLKQKNSELEKMLDVMEQQSRNNNVRVFGMPYEEGEDLRKNMNDLFSNKMKLNITEADIKKCHRVAAKNASADKPPAVLVNFSSDMLRQSVLRNRKSLLSTSIFIKEDLTKYRLLLMKSAMQKFGSKSVWSLHGNVHIKYRGVIHRINSERDINNIR